MADPMNKDTIFSAQKPKKEILKKAQHSMCMRAGYWIKEGLMLDVGRMKRIMMIFYY